MGAHNVPLLVCNFCRILLNAQGAKIRYYFWRSCNVWRTMLSKLHSDSGPLHCQPNVLSAVCSCACTTSILIRGGVPCALAAQSIYSLRIFDVTKSFFGVCVWRII